MDHPVYTRAMVALTEGWLERGPERMPRVVRLHPSDREELVAWLEENPYYRWQRFPRKGPFTLETDLGDVTVEGDEAVAVGEIHLQQASDREHALNVEG